MRGNTQRMQQQILWHRHGDSNIAINDKPHAKRTLKQFFTGKRIYMASFIILFGAVGSYSLFSAFALTPARPKPVATILLHNNASGSSRQMCIDDYRNRATNGTHIISYPCKTTDAAQRWTLYSDGTLHIHGGKCLDVASPFTKPGSKLILYQCNNSKSHTQVWSLTKAQISMVNPVSLVNGATSHLCLAAAQNNTSGSQLTVSSCATNAAAQEWIPQIYNAVYATKRGVNGLQAMYNNTAGSKSRGLFCSQRTSGSGTPSGTCWWQSANELNTIIDYTEQTGDTSFEHDIATTFKYAPKEEAHSTGPFLDRYYDDDSWWGLTWLNAYKLTGNPAYLTTAKNIFHYVNKNAWSPTCGGGIWQFTGLGQHGQQPTKDLGANALYITFATRLYQATGDKTYLYGNGQFGSGAVPTANWFVKNFIITSGQDANLVYGSIAPVNQGSCAVSSGVKQSNYQGMTLEALNNLYEATGNTSYLTQAEKTASAVLADRTNSNPPLIDANDVLTEACIGAPYGCKTSIGSSFTQYKGIFMRDLYCLEQTAGLSNDQTYNAFIDNNARSILNTYPINRTMGTNFTASKTTDYFGFTWDKNTRAGFGWATQGSALDTLNARMGGSFEMCAG